SPHGWWQSTRRRRVDRRPSSFPYTPAPGLKPPAPGSPAVVVPWRRLLGLQVNLDRELLSDPVAGMALVIWTEWCAVRCNLDPNTLLASFGKALGELRPQLLWLTVSYLEDAEPFLTAYRQLYSEAERQGVPVDVGGQALTDALRASMPYTTF